MSIFAENAAINVRCVLNTTMTKVYIMSSCPDCHLVKAKLSGNPNFHLIDIGEHVRNLKEFLHLRDSSPAFTPIKASGSIGIPCFLTEEGRISFDAEEFLTEDFPAGAACSLDGKGC